MWGRKVVRVELSESTSAIWPWIEANQGLVTVTALLVAIGLAFFEHFRLRLDRRRLVNSLRDTMHAHLEGARRFAASAATEPDALKDLRLTLKVAQSSAGSFATALSTASPADYHRLHLIQHAIEALLNMPDEDWATNSGGATGVITNAIDLAQRIGRTRL